MNNSFMNRVSKPERTLGIYLVILYFVVGLLSSVTMYVAATDFFLNPVNAPLNISMLVIYIISIVGLWLMKRWGAILTAGMAGIGAVIVLMNLSYMYLLPEEIEALNPPLWFWNYGALVFSVSLILNVVVAVYVSILIRAERFG